MVAGRKIHAIFAFAILNHFNDCTDSLQAMLTSPQVLDLLVQGHKDSGFSFSFAILNDLIDCTESLQEACEYKSTNTDAEAGAKYKY